ncbi:MAG TPA: CAP domain-containing protein, partial [Flavisolibacter sp.]|nr:CAP domain-containing protein [Flavisolibacter sp.]
KKGCNCGGTYYSPAPALTWNEQLEKAAQAHSTDMYKKRYFSHTSPNGDGAGDRIAKAGYRWQFYAENIGMGYRNENEVVEGWLKSPGHCKNIMNKNYKEMGVAKAGNYWTQTFGAK